MKNSKSALLASLLALCSVPAMAGPNWDIIHRAEANKAARSHEPALAMPLDHGPRAITTPGQNEARLARLLVQGRAEKQGAAVSTEPHHVAASAHTPRTVPAHS